MTPRARNLLLTGLLISAAFAFAYFTLIERQPMQKPTVRPAETAQGVYYCPMHPEKHYDKPGHCPICGMNLVKMEQSAPPPTQENSIFVSPEKQQLIGMRSVPATFGSLTRQIRTTGKVAYDETRVTHIHTKVSGYIEEVYADSVGKPVRAGEPLFTIYSPDLVATQQDYLLALRSRNVLRDSTLASAATGSENLLAAARERLRLWDVTDQEIRALETEGKVKRALPVLSPVTGIVTERAAYHHGTFVDPTKDLFTIVDLSRVWVLAEIYESDLPFVRPGQMAEIEFPYSAGGRKLRGRIDFLYPFLDPKTRTVQARIQFPNPGLTLRPETFTNVRLEISLGRQVLVPQDAVMDTGTEQYVFIDKGDGYVEPRRVKVSPESGDKAGILEGLKTGERVVTAANFLIDSDSRLKGAFANMGKPSSMAGRAEARNQAIAVDILEPKTAKTGMNAIRMLVIDAAGKPVTGAQVDVTLFMPQMGSMAPMTSKAELIETGNGIYAGQIEFQMAWTWQTTVTVRKNQNPIGVVQTSITAR